MAQRRRRVWLNIGGFVLVTGLMVVLSMLQRDQQSIVSCRERLVFATRELQKRLGRGQTELVDLPLPDSKGDSAQPQSEEAFENRAHYFYNSDWWREQPKRKVVGVCCCAAVHDLFLRPDGRHVIVFDGTKYELRWMTEAEFARQGPELGLDVPP